MSKHYHLVYTFKESASCHGMKEAITNYFKLPKGLNGKIYICDSLEHKVPE